MSEILNESSVAGIRDAAQRQLNRSLSAGDEVPFSSIVTLCATVEALRARWEAAEAEIHLQNALIESLRESASSWNTACGKAEIERDEARADADKWKDEAAHCCEFTGEYHDENERLRAALEKIRALPDKWVMDGLASLEAVRIADAALAEQEGAAQ